MVEKIPIIFWAIIGVLVIGMMASILVSGVILKPEYSKNTLKYFNQEFLDRSFGYSRVKLLLYIIYNILRWSAIILFLYLGWNFLSQFSVLKAFLCLAVFLIGLQLITFSISYYSGFVIERLFNLTTQSFSGWLIDYLKSFMVSFFVYLILFGGLYILLLHVPQYWFVIAVFVLIIFIVLGIFLYPLIIDPLFYNFKSLESEPIKSQIKEMASKAGIRVEEILVADASRRTIKANAYFTGLGKSKRIIIYDNLLKNFSEKEALAVIAHEMGHWKKMHLLKKMAVAVAGGILTLFIIKVIINSMNISYDFKAIIIAFLIFSLLSFVVMPLENYISRKFEKEADRLSVGLTQEPEGHIELMQKLARSNLSNVEPSRIVKYIIYSHPPIMERIKAASSFN